MRANTQLSFANFRGPLFLGVSGDGLRQCRGWYLDITRVARLMLISPVWLPVRVRQSGAWAYRMDAAQRVRGRKGFAVLGSAGVVGILRFAQNDKCLIVVGLFFCVSRAGEASRSFGFA